MFLKEMFRFFDSPLPVKRLHSYVNYIHAFLYPTFLKKDNRQFERGKSQIFSENLSAKIFKFPDPGSQFTKLLKENL